MKTLEQRGPGALVGEQGPRVGGPRPIGDSALPPIDAALELNDAVDALKRNMIVAALHETGNKTKAAERLGIPRQSLQKMMKRLQID